MRRAGWWLIAVLFLIGVILAGRWIVTSWVQPVPAEVMPGTETAAPETPGEDGVRSRVGVKEEVTIEVRDPDGTVVHRQ